MTLPPITSAFKYIKRGRFRELLFRSRMVLADSYGALKYDLTNRLNREKFKIVPVNGSQMYVHLEDNGISKDLYLYHGRERFAVEYLKSFIEEDDIVLDVGANIGYYVLVEHQVVKRGKIFACEPAPFNRKLLEMNLALNGIKDVEVFPFAISDVDSQRNFYLYDRINWASFHDNVGGKIVETIKVRTLTIDNLVAEHLHGLRPTLLRMDTEGHEFDIMKGAEALLSSPGKLKIFMEIHPHLLSEAKLDGLLRLLEDSGLKVKAIINECEPHMYGFAKDEIWNSIEAVPYGNLGDSYEKLRWCLRRNKGSEVFFER